MLDELCADIRNYFVQSENDKHAGTYTINGGTFSPPLDFLKAGQYFRVVGSALNDGVYKNDGCCVFLDETFDGSIWVMNVRPAFIALADRIKEYMDSDAAKPTPFVSESFGGYSYSKGQNAAGAANNSWQAVFADELRKWRRISL